MDSIKAVKSRLDALLRVKGLVHEDVWAGINYTEGGYYKMWRNGSLDVPTLLAMETFLKVEPGTLLRDPAPPGMPLAMTAEPAGGNYGKKRYLEDRVERLETELRKIKEQLRQK